jgi:hypothetical protein
MSTTPGWTAQQSEPTPVPWIGGYAWRQRNDAARYGTLGAHDARVAERAATLGEDVDPFPVGAERRSTAPRLTVDRALPLPAVGDEASWPDALAKTPNVAAFWNPAPWPVCCSRLSVLVLVNPTPAELDHVEELAGALDGIAVDPGQDAAWREGIASVHRRAGNDIGLNLFHCRSCGALYGVASHT